VSSYSPDFSTKRMKIYPALSESIKYSQGKNVKSDYYADRSLPVMGRGPDKLYFSSSNGAGVINISDQKFFDDSIIGKVAISGKSLNADMSSESGVIQPRFSYDYVGYTFGMTDNDPLPDYGWKDKPKFDAVKYINDPNSLSELIVNDDPSVIDGLDYNGVLEPLSIRSIVTMATTFIGDELDPEPYSVKAGIGGNYAKEPYSRFNLITNYYQRSDSNRNPPFKFCVDHWLFEGFSKYVPDYAYTINFKVDLEPFKEINTEQLIYRNVSDEEIKNILVTNSLLTSSLDDRPTPDSITRPCGFVYDNNPFGTDSLAFGGLLK
jgi:hypothetical protein